MRLPVYLFHLQAAQKYAKRNKGKAEMANGCPKMAAKSKSKAVAKYSKHFLCWKFNKVPSKAPGQNGHAPVSDSHRNPGRHPLGCPGIYLCSPTPFYIYIYYHPSSLTLGLAGIFQFLVIFRMARQMTKSQHFNNVLWLSRIITLGLPFRSARVCVCVSKCKQSWNKDTSGRDQWQAL